MDEKEARTISFFGTWFKQFEAKLDKLLNSKLEATLTTGLEKLGKDLSKDFKTLEQAVNNIMIPEQKDVVIPPTVFPQLQRVEVTNWKLPEFPEINIPETKFPDINFPQYPTEIKVSNLKDIKIPEVKIPLAPKRQEVFGQVDVKSFGELLSGIQILVDAINDLKLELLNSAIATGGGTTITATPMGSHKEQIKGTTLFDPNDSAPDYIGMHTLPAASTADNKWEIIKNTYSGSNVIKIERRMGVWDNRTSLF